MNNPIVLCDMNLIYHRIILRQEKRGAKNIIDNHTQRNEIVSFSLNFCTLYMGMKLQRKPYCI